MEDIIDLNAEATLNVEDNGQDSEDLIDLAGEVYEVINEPITDDDEDLIDLSAELDEMEDQCEDEGDMIDLTGDFIPCVNNFRTGESCV